MTRTKARSDEPTSWVCTSCGTRGLDAFGALAHMRGDHGIGNEPPFVVRVFEGQSWVPLREAAELHNALQEAGVRIAALTNAARLIRGDS